MKETETDGGRGGQSGKGKETLSYWAKNLAQH